MELCDWELALAKPDCPCKNRRAFESELANLRRLLNNEGGEMTCGRLLYRLRRRASGESGLRPKKIVSVRRGLMLLRKSAAEAPSATSHQCEQITDLVWQ